MIFVYILDGDAARDAEAFFRQEAMMPPVLLRCSEYSAAALLVNPPQEEPRCPFSTMNVNPASLCSLRLPLLCLARCFEGAFPRSRSRSCAGGASYPMKPQ